ncbi:surface antigen (D15) [Actibacterium atlanticum]|uniref:Outer membrane protein assembly factor BamA n=1 Tax=Actibacterium atlanticum TaxID=1461693 RepID=A0A058ZQW1_9RHOB|nr:outer membrane protein assembly factor BamA [Actibacterium atlanticum]KCV83557.1 surface antigen (D15) [Actibacterium atlanticum]
MTTKFGGILGALPSPAAGLCKLALLFFLSFSTVSLVKPDIAEAQSYRFTTVEIVGNQRVDGATILSYAGIGRGQTVSAGQLNTAYQAIVDSGLFEQVTVTPRGSKLVIEVVEYPTINIINFEGNKLLKDEELATIIRSQSRRVYSPSAAEADAAEIVTAYEVQGRVAATVTPRIIRRSDNRVDLVFEVTEGKVVEINRISFVGNREFSGRRLRRVLETKQAGIFRSILRSDTFVADRIDFDKQVLQDFYLSRGYIDFQVLSVTPELTRNRDSFVITFNLREGQQFRVGEVTAISDLAEIDPEVYQEALALRSGVVYSPSLVENNVQRLEALALRQGLDFIRVSPRITRNDRDLTLDVDFVIEKGPRVFVERIDIEGNATTLDNVIRRQFDTVEGDPFNPRAIRDSAERIRALGFFSNAEVNAREGTSTDQVIVDVDVEEQPTGSLAFGLSYSTDDGTGANVSFTERNFLGRGQTIGLSFDTSSESRSLSFNFVEPSFLGRKSGFGLNAYYSKTDNQFSNAYDTTRVGFSPSIIFPISEFSRLGLQYTIEEEDMTNYTGDSAIITFETAQGPQITSSIGYTYSMDTRDVGLDPNAGVLFRLSQELAGLGGDTEYLETNILVAAEKRIFNEDVTLRAEFEGGLLQMISGSSRAIDRFFASGKIRGFQSAGIGPRDLASSNEQALGGNTFAVARFEAEFPLGIDEEIGITGGVFADFGAVWGLNYDNSWGVDDGFHLRSAVGVSIFWDTVLGPLRFNFAKPLEKRPYDRTQEFELTVSTRF